MIRIENALEVIAKNQKDASKDWRALVGNVLNEEYEQTLERKYTEGYADALQSVLELFAEIDIQEISEKLHNDGAQDALIWLEEVYGEGLRETGAWQAYMPAEDSIESN